MKPRSAALLLVLLTAACGDDASGPSGTALSRAEALVVASGIIVAGEAATSSSMTPQDVTLPVGVDAVPVEFTHQQQSSHPCPSGGTVDFDLEASGTMDEEAGSFDITLAGSETHQQCAFPHEDLTITVDGNPDLQFAASAAMVDGLPSEPFTFGVAGALSWATSDGRTGECLVSINAVTDFVARERTLQAQVCGHTLTQTTTWN
jgi:hypothetical protein